MPRKSNQNQKSKILKQIGINIKNIRTSKHITQQSLAELLNTSTNFVSMLERGCSGIDVVTIVNLCKVLKIEPNQLFNNILNQNISSNNNFANAISLLNKNEISLINSIINYMTNK